MILHNKLKLRSHKAFTLIEMIVVLVIMSVMAAIIAPAMSRFYQNIQLDSSVRRLSLLVDAVRLQASLRHEPCRLVIKPGWRKISIEVQATKIIKNAKEAVEYIQNLEAPPPQAESEEKNAHKFVRMEGDFSMFELPSGVKLNYISVSGRQKAPLQELIIVFKPFYQPDEVDFVFENALKEYQGLRLEPGNGTTRALEVIKRD